jgi:phage repressor protein C with HTH and peptisase S24 domain
MAALAEQIGTDASTVNKLEKGRMQLTERWLVEIANALGVSPNDLLIREAPTSSDRGFDFVAETPAGERRAIEVKHRAGKTEVRTAEIEAPALASMPANVPVMGTAAGSLLRGAFALNVATVVDWVRRPPGLHGAGSAYALYIEGTSMEPKFQQGDLVFVHPQRPPRIGDIVIVQCQIGPNEPVEASIGTLKRRTEKAVTIGKLNPVADIDLKRETVIAVHKVLSMNDLFGV